MINAINHPNTQTSAKMQTPTMANVMLRLEGLTGFITALVVYAHLGGSVGLFLLLILVPDLSAIGYAHSLRLGSVMYNIAHFYLVPMLMAAAALAFNIPGLLLLAVIWFAHISMDRIVGYGFKYAHASKDTHLQRV